MTAFLSLHITEWLLGRVDGAVFCPLAAIKQHLMADPLNLLGSTSMVFLVGKFWFLSLPFLRNYYDYYYYHHHYSYHHHYYYYYY